MYKFAALYTAGKCSLNEWGFWLNEIVNCLQQNERSS